MAIWLLMNEILYRGSQREGMVWNFGVVVDQPIGPVVVEPVAVESGQAGEQQIFVVISEVFLDGAIGAFVARVHFGEFG